MSDNAFVYPFTSQFTGAGVAVAGAGVRVGATVGVGLRVGRLVGVEVAEGSSVGEIEGAGVCVSVGVSVTEGETSVPGAAQATSKSKRDKVKRRRGDEEKRR